MHEFPSLYWTVNNWLPIKETLQILYTSVENKRTNQAKTKTLKQQLAAWVSGYLW